MNYSPGDWRKVILATALLSTLGSGHVLAATTYTVQAGDSLYGIAQRFGTSITQLTSLNGLASSQWIYPGQVLALTTAPSAPATKPSTYVVHTGDSLYLIAQRFGTTVAQLQALNKLTSTDIYIGQVLTISSSPSPTPTPPPTPDRYTVRAGDSLYLIGQRTGLTAAELMALNGLTSSTIYPGQVLQISKVSPQPSPIPAPQPSTPPITTNTGVTLLPGEWIKSTGNSTFQIIMLPDPANMSQAQLDLYWLSRIIDTEAGAEPYEGKVAVGNVILNRVKSAQFPNTVKDVIFDDYQGIPQFAPVLDGSLRQTPSNESIKAAQDALSGIRPVGAALYFLNPAKAGVTWIQQNRTYLKTIGGHDFYL